MCLGEGKEIDVIVVIFSDHPRGMFVLEKPWCGMDGRTGPPLLNLWSFVLRKGDYSRGYSELRARTYKETHFTSREERAFWWLQLTTGQSRWLVDLPDEGMGVFKLSVLGDQDTV